MTVYIVMYSYGEDGDAVAGAYSTLELAEAAKQKSDGAAWDIVSREIDAEPIYNVVE